MTRSATFHGWKLTHRTVEEGDPIFPGRAGSPMLVMEKAGRNTISIVGRPGIDPAILEQRAKVDALAQDVAASAPDDRDLWEKRLRQAEQERDEAEALRSFAAGMAAARAAQAGQEG